MLNLANTGNTFKGSVLLNNTGTYDVSVANSGALVIGTSNIGNGNFTLTSGGSISETGVITQEANAGITTFIFTSPSSDLLLGNEQNNLNGYLEVAGTLSNLRDVAFQNIGAGGAPLIDLTSLSNLRNLTVILENTTAVSLPALTLHNGGNLVLDTSGDSIGSGGSIGQTGPIVVPGTTNLNAGANPITFTDSGNIFTGTVTLTNNHANDIALTNSTALILGNVSAGTGTLTLNGVGITQATGTTITQAIGAGNASFTGNAGMINLSNTGNSFTGSVLLNNTGANDVSVTNSGALAIGTSNIGSGNFNLTSGGTISETGAITQEASAGITTFIFTTPSSDLLWSNEPNNLNGFLDVAGNLGNLRDVAFRNIGSGGAALIDLTSLTNLRNLTVILDNTASVALPALTLHDGGNLVLDTSGDLSGGTGGSISQTGALVIPGTTNLNAGAHPIDFSTNGSGNSFTGTVTLTNSGANDVSLTNSIALTLGNVSVGTGALTITGAGMTQAVGTSITQAAGAGNANFTSSNGAITLTNTDNTFTGSVLLSTSGSDNASLTNSGPTTLGTTTVGGTMSITSGGTVNQTGLITIVNGGAYFDLTVPDSDLLFLSFPNNFGPVPLQGNPAHFGNVRDIEIQTTGTTQISSGLSYLANLRNLTLIIDSGGVSFPGFSLSGNLNITANGSITETGSINASSGTTTLAVTAPLSDILLGSQANHFGTNPIIFGGTLSNIRDLAIRNVNSGAVLPNFTGLSNLRNLTVSFDNAAIAFPAITVGGDFTVSAGGSITQSGALTIGGIPTFTVTAPNSDILMNTAANNFDGIPVITSNGDVRDLALRNISATASAPTLLPTGMRNLTLEFDNATIEIPSVTLSGNLTAIAQGQIYQSGALSGSSLIAETLNNAGSPINLTDNSNNFTMINLSTLNAAGTANAAGSVAYNNTGGLNVNGINTTSRVNLTAGGAITDSGAIIGSELTTNSVGGTVLSFGNDIASFNATNSGSGNIQLSNTANLLTISGITQSGSGNVIVTNTGALTTSDVINTNGGNVNLTTLSPDSSARVLTINASIQTQGGAVDLDAANNSSHSAVALVVNNSVSTTPGSGGTLTLGGGLTLNVDPTIGAGNITLNGNGLDLVLGALNLSTSTTFEVNRYLVVNGALTSSSNVNIGLNADDNLSGVGGVLITSIGSINSGGSLTIQGSSLNGLTGYVGVDPNAGIQIQSGASIQASGPIVLTTHSISNANIDINGPVSANSTNAVTITTAGTGTIQLGANVSSQSGAITLNGPVVVSTDVALTGSNIAINNGISGGANLSLVGQPGNDNFSLTGPLSLNNITVTGSGAGNNTLTVNGVGFENWLLTGANQGTISVAGVAGTFAFTNTQNLTGGNSGNTFTFNNGASTSGLIDGNNLSNINSLNFSSYSTPITALLANLLYSGTILNNVGNVIAQFVNVNSLVGSGASTLRLSSTPNTLTFNSANSGYVSDPLYFAQFMSFSTLNSNDHVIFIANATYNSVTGQVTINGIPVQMAGFNPNYFSGNVTIINPIPPTPVITPTINIPSVLMVQPLYYSIKNNNGIDITINEIQSSLTNGTVIIPGVNANGIAENFVISPSAVTKIPRLNY